VCPVAVAGASGAEGAAAWQQAAAQARHFPRGRAGQQALDGRSGGIGARRCICTGRAQGSPCVARERSRIQGKLMPLLSADSLSWMFGGGLSFVFLWLISVPST